MLQRNRDVVYSIQALRALAVGLVVLNHFFKGHFPGGYIGVDIFFVVSGFLISSHLLRELTGGSLNFTRFYLRRARRLLPASLLVLALTCLAVSLSMPSAWQVANLKDAAAAAAYCVNWRFAASAVNYFAESGFLSPVNHYWSLSVEEQFYLVWPALMFFSLRIAVARTRRTAESLIPVVIGVLMATILALSLISAILSIRHNPTVAYFLTYARAWEFAAGGLAAVILSNLKNQLSASWIKLLFAAAWLILIACGRFLGPESGVPGLAAVPAVIAASIVLVIGDDHGSPVASRIIGSAPVQWMGDISYSLYLWHWPLLILASLVLGVAKMSIASRIVLLGISLALSGITKRYVEDRFRFVGPGQKRTALSSSNAAPALATYLLMSASVATLAFLGARLLEAKSIKAGEKLYRLSMIPGPCFGARAIEPGASCPNSHLLADRDFAMESLKTQIIVFPVDGITKRWPKVSFCLNPVGDPALAPCEFGAAENATRERIAVFGDSHAGMWEPALAMFVAPRGIRVKSFLAGSCPISDDDSSLEFYVLPQDRDACRIWRRTAADAIIADKQIDTVVISDNAYRQKILNGSGGWSEDDGNGVAEILRRFHAAGKRVVVIDDVPNLPFALPDCLARARTNNDPCTVDESQIPASTPLGRAVALMPPGEIDYLNFRDVFCDGTVCHTVIGGVPAYMDSNHVTAPFARSLASRIEKLIANNEPPEPHRPSIAATEAIRNQPAP